MVYRKGVLIGNFFEESFAGPRGLTLQSASSTKTSDRSLSQQVHNGRQQAADSTDDGARVETGLPAFLLFGHCGNEKKIGNFSTRRFGTTKQQAECAMKSFEPGNFFFPEIPSRPRHAQITRSLDSNSRVLGLRNKH